MDKLKELSAKNNINLFLDFFINNHKTFKKYNTNQILKINDYVTNIFINSKISSIILNGNEEINTLKNHKIKYHVIKTDNDINKKALLVYLYLYYLLTKKVKMDYIIPLDFEFNTKKVALMQTNFETDFINRFIFYIFDVKVNQTLGVDCISFLEIFDYSQLKN